MRRRDPHFVKPDKSFPPPLLPAKKTGKLIWAVRPSMAYVNPTSPGGAVDKTDKTTRTNTTDKTNLGRRATDNAQEREFFRGPLAAHSWRPTHSSPRVGSGRGGVLSFSGFSRMRKLGYLTAWSRPSSVNGAEPVLEATCVGTNQFAANPVQENGCTRTTK